MVVIAGCAESQRPSPVTEKPDAAAAGKDSKVTTLTWQEAKQRLVDGNQRFVADRAKHPHQESTWRGGLHDGQHPFATILGCSDSRVPPELLFDQGCGDLFVIRVAGNIVDPDIAGSIEYAIHHLHTPLVVVLGHEDCGAVTAALDLYRHPHREPHEIETLLRSIRPAIKGIKENAPREQQIARAVEENVRLSIRRLCDIPDLENALQHREMKIVGAIYDLDSGKVQFFPD